MVAVNPIAFSCYSSLFEFLTIFKHYIATVQDWRKLTYNLIHNLGKIYDNIDDLIDLFSSNFSVNNDNVWKHSGYLIGDTINQIAYKPTNYDPYFGK